MSHDTRSRSLVMGLDVSDRSAHYFIGEARRNLPGVEQGKIPLSAGAVRKKFGSRPPMTVALEVGTHSPWLAELFEELGHEVIVANPRQLPLIYASRKKNDALDAKRLAQLASFDRDLLCPLEHRSRDTRLDLVAIRARDVLVRGRANLVNAVRGMVKQFGVRIPSGSTPCFPRRSRESLPEDVLGSIEPLLGSIEELTLQIDAYDQKIAALCKKHPVTELLRTISGVGPLTALAFVLILEDPKRFQRSRAVGSYVGLTPRQSDSGDHEPQLRITKHGDELLRRYLVNAAHYVLGRHGPDSELRTWGERIHDRGGKRAKKRAVVAVARKLSVIMHRLWQSGEVYDPHYREQRWSKVS